LPWLDTALDTLAKSPVCGYARGQAPATEPTALAALALAAHGRADAAAPAIGFLKEIQAEDGSVGVRAGESEPGWPTSLALLAWKATNRAGLNDERMARAARWILTSQGKPLEKSDEFGHNTEVVAWSWAAATHSWIEPTALHVTALKAVGKGDHPRVRDGVAMLLDRQLLSGGCNYGNTVVLGQTLRPHVQSTGIALLALAGEGAVGNSLRGVPSAATHARIAKSIAWLKRSIGPETTASSLAWALLGLRAHGVVIPLADEWLAAHSRDCCNSRPHTYKLALLALAAKGLPQ
jgi:hypothetical protein